MKRLKMSWYIIVFVFIQGSALGQQDVVKNQDVIIDIDFSGKNAASGSGTMEETGYSKQIDDIFKNPVVINGIDTGTEAINRSLESIMDSVFYSLLDNDKRIPLTDQSWFQLGIRRNLIHANNGRYIVVDRFYLGPGFQRKLFETIGVPWILGAEATGEILQVYLQTDGKRVLEQQKIATLRNRSNSWFGVLPFLSSILPPSFNQNELYDPVTEILTPITFPLTIEKFKEMPVGSIRSYSLTGGIRLSPDLAGLIPNEKLDQLKRIGDLAAGMPISLFKRGEHRINVFRKDVSKAWVGVNEVDRDGILFEGNLGTIYAVFKGAMAFDIGSFSWVWNGFPIAFTPLNFNYQKALAKLFDQVYEFDLSIPKAKECYEKSVLGDFESAFNAAKRNLEGVDTGVVFQFSRIQNRAEKSSKRGPNVAVYKEVRETSVLKNEIEIRDFLGKYFILETMGEVIDKNWNILVGEMEERVQSVVEMFVKPFDDVKNDKRIFYYENPLNPYRLVINYNIEDRYTNTEEFKEYINRVRFVSGMPIKIGEKIPLLDSLKIKSRRQQLYSISPDKSMEVLHVSPTALGRLSAQVVLSFPFEAIKVALQISREDLYAKVREAFGVEYPNSQLRTNPGLGNDVLAFLVKPLDMLNLRFPLLDEQDFAEGVFLAIEKIKRRMMPEDQLVGFLKLLDTAYPRQLTKLLLMISPMELVSRKVTFSTKPISGLSKQEKDIFTMLNGYEEYSGLPFPPGSRYGRIKEKIAQFYLDKPQSHISMIEISHVQVFTKKVPLSWFQEQNWRTSALQLEPQVFLSLFVNREIVDDQFKLYMRMEEGGRLQLGKFDLGEIVLDGKDLQKSYGGDGKISYGTYLTGPSSFFDKLGVVDLGQKATSFRLVLAVSQDGESWGSERVVEFYFDGEVLKPLR